jgi:hypothetical protein
VYNGGAAAGTAVPRSWQSMLPPSASVYATGALSQHPPACASSDMMLSRPETAAPVSSQDSFARHDSGAVNRAAQQRVANLMDSWMHPQADLTPPDGPMRGFAHQLPTAMMHEQQYGAMPQSHSLFAQRIGGPTGPLAFSASSASVPTQASVASFEHARIVAGNVAQQQLSYPAGPPHSLGRQFNAPGFPATFHPQALHF